MDSESVGSGPVSLEVEVVDNIETEADRRRRVVVGLVALGVLAVAADRAWSGVGR